MAVSGLKALKFKWLLAVNNTSELLSAAPRPFSFREDGACSPSLCFPLCQYGRTELHQPNLWETGWIREELKHQKIQGGLSFH